MYTAITQKRVVANHNPLVNANINRNNFDILRLALALLVMVSHCFVIYYGKSIDTEPGMILTRNQTDIGSIAVNCFFIISGFLILKSFDNSSSTIDYLKRRALRILPAFFVAFLISLLLVGPLGTIDREHLFGQWKTYYTSIDKRQVLTDLIMLKAPHVPECLAKVHIAGRVNSSLWTIQYEFVCYLLLPLLAFCRLLQNRIVVLGLFLAAYITLVLQEHANMFLFELEHDNVFSDYIKLTYLPRFFAYFLSGSCFYLYRDVIPRKRILFILSIIAIAVSCFWVKGINLTFPIAGSYLLNYVAFHPNASFPNFARNGDFSYGVYLYAWPIQQLLMYFLHGYLNVFTLFCLVLPIVFFAAYLSWHYIEKPFLSLKKRRQQNVSVSTKNIILN